MTMSKSAKNKGSRKTVKISLFTLNSTGSELVYRTDCPWWERASQIFALAILTLFPLMVGSKGYYDITDVKFYIFAVMTCVYLFFCALIGIAFPPGNKKGKGARSLPLQRPTLPQMILCGYMAWAAVCTLVSPYEGLWMGQGRFEGLCSLLLYGAVFLLLSFWGEYTDAYFYGLAIAGAGVGLTGLAQGFGARFFYPGEYNYWNSAFLSTLGQQDCVAGFICIAVPALLCGFVILNGKWRYLFLPALFLLPYLAVFTDVDTAKLGFGLVVLFLPFLFESRGRLGRLLTGLAPVLLGTAFALAFEGEEQARHLAPGKATAALALCAAAFCLLGWMIGKDTGRGEKPAAASSASAAAAVRGAKNSRERKPMPAAASVPSDMPLGEKPWPVKPSAVRRAGYAALFALMLIGVVFVYGYSGEKAMLRELSGLLHGELSDEAGTYRGYIWKAAVKIIAQRPVLGGGPGSFFSLFKPYNEGYNDLSQYGVAVDFAHNDFLNIAACTGLPGLGLYLAFLVSLAVRCVRALRRCPAMLILLAGLLGYLVYSFFVFSIAIVSPLFWVLAGVADKCARQAEKSPGGSNS